MLRPRLAIWLVILVIATGCGLGSAPGTGFAAGPIPPVSSLRLGPGGGDPLIVGHRGGSSGKAPENTMAAFRLGPTHGATTLECDVHCSQDGALVVIHDSTVDRTTNGKGAVRKLTLAGLKALDAGGGERIPTLDELLDWIATQPGLKLVVEVKAKPKICPDIADKVVDAIKRRHLGDRTLVISFHRKAVERVEQVHPELRTGLLFLVRLNPIRTARSIHADMVWPGRQRTTTRFVRSAKEAGLGVFSWTLNSGHHLLEARRVGVDGVVTDYPDVAKDAFEHGIAPVPAPGASESVDPEDREDPEDLAAEEGR